MCLVFKLEIALHPKTLLQQFLVRDGGNIALLEFPEELEMYSMSSQRFFKELSPWDIAYSQGRVQVR